MYSASASRDLEEQLMDDFVKMAAGRFGINESAAQSATAGVLKALQSQLGDGSFKQLLDKMPDAASLMAEKTAADDSGPGMGGLLGRATSMLGSDGSASVLKSLTGAGLDISQSSSFLSMFADFIKQRVGDDLWDEIAGVVPGVK